MTGGVGLLGYFWLCACSNRIGKWYTEKAVDSILASFNYKGPWKLSGGNCIFIS